MTDQQWQFAEGDEVFAADGDKIGKLRAIEGDRLVVEKGWLFPSEYYVPLSAVTSYSEDGAIFLNLTKDQALNSGWDTIEDESYVTGDARELGYETDADLAGTRFNDQTTARRVGTTDDDNLIVPVHEERLEATTVSREAGAVRVNKHVVEQDQTISVPVTEEQVEITRRVVDRDAVTGDEVFRDETIAVPLQTEDVKLNKRTRVAEEVQVSKRQVERTQDVTGTVRKEVVDVDDSSTRTDSTRGGDRKQ